MTFMRALLVARIVSVRRKWLMKGYRDQPAPAGRHNGTALPRGAGGARCQDAADDLCRGLDAMFFDLGGRWFWNHDLEHAFVDREDSGAAISRYAAARSCMAAPW